MKKMLRALLMLAVVPLHAASAPGETTAEAKPAKPARGSGFVFSLLPKSLQKNPRLDFNIHTDMSPAGRSAPNPSPAHPVYYVAQAGRMVNTGVGAEGLAGPPVEQLEKMMTKALAERGYVAADVKHQPSIIVVYNWGSSSFQPPADVSDENGQGNVEVPEIVLRRALVERARLLGGAEFLKAVLLAMEQVDQKARLSRSATPEGGDFMGTVGGMMRDPFDELRGRGGEMERLVDELFSSSYFVIASAYDYAAVAKGQRVLLWRTKMTVNSLGVNMAESVPPLIASATAYLGTETKEPVVVTKRISREGRVDVGTPVVVPEKK